MSKALFKGYTKLMQRVLPLKLQRWRSAGILLTYRCNAECADCYESSSPRNRAILPVEDARLYLRELKKLGMTGRELHFAGGEPFFDYKHLLQCLEAAREEGMLPLGKLETNAFWCKSERMARERLAEIKSFGVLELLVSSDEFHQEFVPIEAVQRAERIGREILGEKAVRVNRQEFLDHPIDMMKLPAEERMEVFREVLQTQSWRLVGRAAKTLSHLVEKYPKERFAGDHCAWKLLGKRTIHIDPYGNVFPSICVGIIIGNAKRQPLSEMCESYEYRDHPLVKTLAERGPLPLLEVHIRRLKQKLPLLEEAIRHGLAEDKDGYVSKCHLCFVARTFLRERGLYPDEVGPDEVYGGCGPSELIARPGGADGVAGG